MVEFLLLALASFGAMTRGASRPVLIADAAGVLVRSPSSMRHLLCVIVTGVKPCTKACGAAGVTDRRRTCRVARAAGTDQADSRATE
jgi:hypothetical protein